MTRKTDECLTVQQVNTLKTLTTRRCYLCKHYGRIRNTCLLKDCGHYMTSIHPEKRGCVFFIKVERLPQPQMLPKSKRMLMIV